MPPNDFALDGPNIASRALVISERNSVCTTVQRASNTYARSFVFVLGSWVNTMRGAGRNTES